MNSKKDAKERKESKKKEAKVSRREKADEKDEPCMEEEIEEGEASIVEETDEEIIEDEDEEEEEPANFRMEDCWKFLNPPTLEEEIVGKWFACIFATKRAVNLYVGRARRRFLTDSLENNGYAAAIEIEGLQQKLGVTNCILEEFKNSSDIYNYPIRDVICGPLKAKFLGGGKWEFFEYGQVRTLFDTVKKSDRQKLYENFVFSRIETEEKDI